ncbi:anoctamin-4-like [Actinia tenebrosa]|uniref:Anoctamin n=1 Tax=Actinia tenebrosa TaxID=6105 RepID=A0A6P8ITW8_ACTTE|nr:anoctamin-4-like [Actinia tenebrosa]
MAGRGSYRITPTGITPRNNMAAYGGGDYYAGYPPSQQQPSAPIGFELHSHSNQPPSSAYPPRDDLYRPPQQHYPPSQYPPPSGQQPSGQDYSHGGPSRPVSSPNLPPVGFEGEILSSGESRIRPSSQDTSDGASRPTYRVKEQTRHTETLFFKTDPAKRIDYVLAYEINTAKPYEWQQKREEKRKAFEKSLIDFGLKLEKVGEEESSNGRTAFVKVHAPWKVLAKIAEEMMMKMPISLNDMDTSDWTERCFDCIGIRNPFELRNEDLPEERNYFTGAFRQDKMSKFLIEDRDTFFSQAQRGRIVYTLLQRAKYGSNKTTQVGIERLIANGTYAAAYPLHEGNYKMEQSMLTHKPENERQLLYEVWASPKRWYQMQPLDQISNYFGEKIGLYFAWLGFYTGMLVPAALVGLVVLIYGGANLASYTPAIDICNETKKLDYPMCPRCDQKCPYWALYDTCVYSKVTYVFDNEFTPIFAIFMSIWATMFLEFWKRRQAEISYEWDLMNFEDEEERPRVEYETKAKEKRINPITKNEEPYLHFRTKLPRFTCSWTFICFMLMLVVAAVLGVVFYRVSVYASLITSEGYEGNMGAISMATSATAAIINLVIIIFLNKLYERLAFIFTNWEMPRTQTQYEDNFTFKMYLFQFVNYYSSLFYIAFGKLNPGPPGNYNRVLGSKENEDGFRQEECNPAGCLFELLLQLAIIMVGKQILNNLLEIVLPKLKNWWKSRKNLEPPDLSGYTRWELDYDLYDYPKYGLFYEYLEMVIQFGFITIFVTAFPLGPLFALINNLIEIRLDAYKFVCVFRRPMAARAQDIGIWYAILNGVTKLSVVVNAFVIAFVSEFVPRLYYRYGGDGHDDLTGFLDSSLSCFAISNFTDKERPDSDLSKGNFNPDSCGLGVPTCRFRGYYEPPFLLIGGVNVTNPNGFTTSKAHWHIVAAKLFFVIAFLHIVFAVTSLLAWLIPDVPKTVSNQVKRENFLAREALRTQELPTVDND